jgi:hypothetical protein
LEVLTARASAGIVAVPCVFPWRVIVGFGAGGFGVGDGFGDVGAVGDAGVEGAPDTTVGDDGSALTSCLAALPHAASTMTDTAKAMTRWTV